jgi:DNA-binding MarR family transcriptional regulator
MELPPKSATPRTGVVYQTIPDELQQLEQWVCYKLETRTTSTGTTKATKIPYSPLTGRKASSTDPATWAAFEDALDAQLADGYDGLGFVFCESDPFTGVDLDGCANPSTGAISEHAWEWVEAFDTYAEVSPSGTGLHLIVRGQLETGRHNDRAGVEAYSRARFFTVTGDAITGAGIRRMPERQDVLNQLVERYFPKPVETPPPTPSQPIDLSDGELTERARNARKGMGERFAALYDRGDLLEHPSHSEARHELLKHLAFWTGCDPDRMDRLYRGSALYSTPDYAKKWERLGEREIQRAIERTSRCYRQEVTASNGAGGELPKIVEALKAQAASLSWEGRSGPTDRAVYGALLGIAATYGSIAKKGIIVSADMRTLALEGGTSLPTVRKALDRLRSERKLICLSKKSTGKHAHVYLLRYPEATQGLYTKQCAVYVQPLSQMRNRGPSTQKDFDKNGRKISHGARFLLERLGKLTALVVERVAVKQGLTLSELALDLDRRPANVRRVVERAVEAGLVQRSPDGTLTAPEDLAYRIRVEVEESGCVDARERDAKRYAEEREAFYSRGERDADEAPTQEQMDRERLQRVQDALDALQTPRTGPAMILRAYLDGETRSFEYVVNAVAYYYASHNPEVWRQPVERAVELITEHRGGG